MKKIILNQVEDGILQASDPIKGIQIKKQDEFSTICLDMDYAAVYGTGERFGCVDQKGKTVEIKVFEQFCNQGENTYCPVPFFFTDSGVGVFLDTLGIVKFDFQENIEIEVKKDSKGALPMMYLFYGTPKEILCEFTGLTGRPLITPKWSFGVWMSANRWNTRQEVEKQILLYDQHQLPANVMVLEAWSDEATFYRWKEEMEDPKSMIEELHKREIKLILWQIPVIKKLEEGRRNSLHEADWDYVKRRGLCVHNVDGSPYVIPEGRWFGGSMIPDYSNPEMVQWWFERRQYLLDMGVDGFKTDGGEFVYTEDVKFHDGTTGIEMQNGYPSSYVEAYTNFIGNQRVLFSRAGYTGQQRYPMQWAGDQQSTWGELGHVLVAGLSSGLSGIPLWGFDIAGFAGAMPSVELYERSTQLAVFTPVMQWHSEPAGGQFAELMPSAEGINDRSPWNMAAVYGDTELVSRLRFHYNLRTNLLPYLYSLALESGKDGCPMMKHLVMEFPKDKNVYGIEDSFLLGSILVSPVIREGQIAKEVYLPKGGWTSLWTGERIRGERTVVVGCGKERIPAFVRDGSCIPCNFGEDENLGSYVGNGMAGYENLCFCLFGDQGTYHFQDDQGNEIRLHWNEKEVKVTVISGETPYRILWGCQM